MPIFEYKGLNQGGRNVRGTIDAENNRAARQRLKRDGIFVVDLKDKTKTAAKSKRATTSAKKVNVTVLR